jgi:hypothetical protein
MNERNCVNCVHWYWDAGDPGWSELTPGTGWESYCRKNKWEMNGADVTEEQFRKNMNTANSCEFYEAKP